MEVLKTTLLKLEHERDFYKELYEVKSNEVTMLFKTYSTYIDIIQDLRAEVKELKKELEGNGKGD